MKIRKNGSFSGPDVLNSSDQDTIALAMSIETRFLDLCGAYFRIRGVQLKIPPVMKSAFLKWREMLLRHGSGDFRNTKSELIATREVANWTHRANCILRNQDYYPIQWKS